MTTTTVSAPTSDPFVQHCCNAYNQAYAAEREKGAQICDARGAAIDAYRNSMPCLTGYVQIRAFVACVTHGMLLNIIYPSDGSGLLSAAKVALSVLRNEPPEK